MEPTPESPHEKNYPPDRNNAPPGDTPRSVPDLRISDRDLDTRRRGSNNTAVYLWFTIVVCLIAITLEKFGHILAQVYGDPLPHYGYLSAYLVATLAPLYTNWVLTKTASYPVDTARMMPHLVLAFAGNAITLLMAGLMGLALLPIAPFAVIACSFFGFGLTGLSPYFLLGLGIAQGIQLRRTLRDNNLTLPRGAWLGTIATVITTALALFVHPIISGALLATALRPDQSPAEERRTADQLHRFGGDNAVLIQSYSTSLPIWESLGMTLADNEQSHWYYLDFGRRNAAEPKQARRLYYLMTGQSYTHAPVPWTISNNRSEQWINDIAAEDVGGTRVGRKAEGISLASKTGTAILDPRNATGECDFTLRFANNSDTANEARAEILLPPGAVCHHASLWINNTERPAAFGPQATVRRAYEQVAVVQRRDPLLVTMPVPGKLLVQCFPIPAKGNMQIRLGITFPLTPDPSDRRKMSYALPAWGDTNFANPGTLANSLVLTDASTGKPPVLPLSLAPHSRWSERALARRPVNLLVALDQSSGMNAAFGKQEQAALRDATATLPVGSTVSYVGMDGKPQLNIDNLLRFRAGQDNVAWLAKTIQSASMDTVVLYLHAGTPDSVSDPAPLANVVKALPSTEHPRFVSLLLAKGAPDVVGDRLAMQKNARAASVAGYPTVSNAIAATVENIVRDESLPEALSGLGYVPSDSEQRSKRLHAYRSALDVWYIHNNFGPEALAAARAAAKLRLVTPISGAVVLETQADYNKHGLDDGTQKDQAKDTLITPEPATWVLMIVGTIAVLCYGWHHRKTWYARQV